MAAPNTPPPTPRFSTMDKTNMFNDKMSVSEAEKLKEKTTQEQLAQLAKSIQEAANKPMELTIPDDNIPLDEESSTDSSDYIPPAEKKRKHSKHDISVLSASDRIYQDNQNLWKKMNKTSAALERIEERLRYVQLDLNNKHVECDKAHAEVGRLKSVCKMQLTAAKLIEYKYKALMVYFALMTLANVSLILYTFAGVNLFVVTYNWIGEIIAINLKIWDLVFTMAKNYKTFMVMG